MAVTVEDLILYCRIDLPDTEDSAYASGLTLLESLQSAAEAYLDNAGVEKPEDDDSPLYDQAVKGLVLHWYDNRNAIAYNRSMIPLGLRQVITQLKMEAVANGG